MNNLLIEEWAFEDAAPDGVNRELRPAVQFLNGIIYSGEWNVSEETKDGRGIQVWPDGSKYEGYWKNNQANGQGRLVHRYPNFHL